ncbi:hypothetical protein ACF0H5_012566 [Mactra antiquata]
MIDFNAVYVDHAGATLVARQQLEAHHEDILCNLYGNPHSRSLSSQLTTDTIDQIRFRILEHFHTTQDEYSVVFTAGCTAALKLVAECFDYHGYGCHGSNCHGNNGESEESSHKFEKAKNAAGVQNEVKEESNKLKDEVTNDKGCHGSWCSSRSCCHGDGSFSYLLDNHTSVQGMRELALDRSGRVQCLDINEADSDKIFVKSILKSDSEVNFGGNHLFAFPAQSNFNGRKYPLRWINMAKQGHLDWQEFIQCKSSRSEYFQGHMYVVLDAASYVSTSSLNLNDCKPDFVSISFYKMFGYPTGLGALLVRNQSAHVLKKTYFGGGTVSVSLPSQRYHVSRTSISERFEDGTLPYLDIIALRHGFDVIEKLAGGMDNITIHTFHLAQYFYNSLSSCYHDTGTQLAEIYTDNCYNDNTKQGAIISFNLLRDNGDHVGFSEVDKLAQLYNIHLRTGCFCNIGACQKYLNMSDDQIKHNFDAGHVCGDDRDLVDGKPTGAVRISFGYMSSLDDVRKCLQFIVDCFLVSSSKPVFVDKTLDVNQSMSINSTVCNESRTESKKRLDSKERLRSRERLSSKERLFEVEISSQKESSAADNSVKDNIEIVHEKHETELTKDDIAIDKASSNDCQPLKPYEVTSSSSNQDTDERLMFSPCEGRYLADIFLYPVKSCAAFKVKQWPLCDRGLLYDRGWMIISSSGIAMSQKREPRLCLVQPTIDLHKLCLTLNFPGMEPIDISFAQTTESDDMTTNLCNSKVCGDRVHSLDCGQDAGEWLSEALGKQGCRLVRQASNDNRSSKLKQSADNMEKLSLANESQYLLISRNSVSDLYDRIKIRQENGETQDFIDGIDNLVDRFRGNLVVNGCLSFEEEQWKTIQIGNLIFRSQGTCTRCQMVCFDQHTGEKSSEPLKTLAVWRGTKVPFGIHLSNGISSSHGDNQSVITVGDPVFIL